MTNAHAPARLLTFLVVASAAVTARAQSPAFEWETSVTWPASLGDPGSIGRVVSGDIDGDLRPDVFARGAPSPGTPDGSYDILFLYAPWLGSGVQKLGIRAIDFDFQKGSPGKLAFTKHSGLWTLAWDVTEDPPFVETQIASGAPWAGATKVRCGDLDGSAGQDYVGVAPDGHTLVLRRTNSGGTTTVLVDVVDQVVDLFTLQWIQGGAQEVAVLTTDDLFLYDGTGTLLDTFTPPFAGAGVIAPVRFGTDGPDRVAWISRGSTGATTRFDLVRRASPQVEGPMTPQYDDVIAMATADFDNDGDEDLVMTHRDDRLAWLYKSGFADGTSRVFSPNRSQLVHDPRLNPNDVLPNGATFIFRDLGNDHRPDLLLPVEVEGVTTFEILSTVYRADATSAEVFGGIATQSFELDTQQNPLEVAFKFKTLDFDPADLMTHVQVIVWNQESATTPLTPEADSAAQYYTIDSLQFGAPDPFWEVYSVDVDLDPEDTACTMPVRWIEVRLVRMVGTEMDFSGPTYTCAIVTRLDDFCIIDGLGTQEMELVPTLLCDFASSCMPGLGSFAGQAIPRTRKPGPPSGFVTSVNLGNPANGLPIPD